MPLKRYFQCGFERHPPPPPPPPPPIRELENLLFTMTLVVKMKADPKMHHVSTDNYIFLFYNYLFLQERQLRALQYLPDIIKLQRLLFEKFHRRLDRNEAEEYTLGTFLKRSKKNFFFNFYIPRANGEPTPVRAYARPRVTNSARLFTPG